MNHAKLAQFARLFVPSHRNAAPVDIRLVGQDRDSAVGLDLEQVVVEPQVVRIDSHDPAGAILQYHEEHLRFILGHNALSVAVQEYLDVAVKRAAPNGPAAADFISEDLRIVGADIDVLAVALVYHDVGTRKQIAAPAAFDPLPGPVPAPEAALWPILNVNLPAPWCVRALADHPGATDGQHLGEPLILGHQHKSPAGNQVINPHRN